MQCSVWSPCLLVILLLYGVLPVALTQVVKKASNRTNVVVIGHIGAIGALPNYEKVLDLARQELLKDGTLGADFDIEIISRNGCGEAFEGVAAAADLYHIEHINIFLGPYCNAEMIPVATMANFWNVPIIAYMASANVLSNKKIYKTLVRTSLRTMNTIAESTAAFIKHYKWKKVSLVSNVGASAFEKLSAFEPVLKRNNIAVTRKILFDETVTVQDILNGGQLDEIRSNSRIVLVMFSSTRDITAVFREATAKFGLSEAEFVFIFPWLQEGANGASPFVGSDSSSLDKVKQLYSNCVLIDDTNGFDDRMITPFLERLSSIGLKETDISLNNVYGYIALFDSLKMFATAGRRILNRTGKFSSLSDGKLMWNSMRRITVQGMVSNAGVGSGTVMLDDLAERIPFYSAFFVDKAREEADVDNPVYNGHGTAKVRPFANMAPSLITNCDGLETGTGCFEINVTEVSSSFWPSIDGNLPTDEPVCGFRGEKCDYTLIIVAASATLCFLLTIAGAWALRRYCETKALNLMSWRIFRDDMQIVDEEQVKSMLSLNSQRTKLSNANMSLLQHHAIIGVNTHATYHMYEQRRPIKFNRADLTLLTKMKQAVHDNLNPFLGIAFNEKSELLILWKFCSRGTLQDVIYNEQFVLDDKFHGAFVKDITLGLEYLHLSTIGFHGALTTWSTLIDRNWQVKLTDYGVSDAVCRWKKHGSINDEIMKDGEEKTEGGQKTAILYVAPEIRISDDQNKSRRVDQSWTLEKRRSADIYAFGMVMYEILFRNYPYSDKTDISELVTKALAGEKISRPSVQKDKQLHPDLQALLQDCWHDTPDARPSIRRVRLSADAILKTKGSLVDSMTRMMEEYGNNLEKLVNERTGMLEEATIRADKLLSQLLPKYVANELKNGRPVPPKMYNSATVMFTDVVGFTKLCGSSTPIEVVTLLNSVYSGFDEIINKHDGYKVETIGDAYMVVSGIPEENGKRHINNISEIALDIMTFLETYRIPHRKSEQLVIRVGYHSGQVAAAVVGLNSPRYCLFGDTVNMASRMESSGEPGKIQLSAQSKKLLDNDYPEFVTTKRGEIDVKGKGECCTYWLLRKDNSYFSNAT
uniref:guanylate cyclase n=1 Tax=Haemonchus contortus TaxID=6289 RepID=A0A7I4Y1F3_HAECO